MAYLCMATLNVLLTVLLAPPLGCWAPAIGYVVYVVLGCGLFMNWYYQVRIGLDMAYFWRKVLPVVGAGVMAVATCALGVVFLPVINWLAFAGWGIVYSIVYLAIVSLFALTPGERASVKKRLRRV